MTTEVTITLDEDVASVLQEQAKAQSKPLRELGNEAMRIGLTVGDAGVRPAFVIRTFSSEYQPGINPDRLKDYLNDEDDEAFRRLQEDRS